MTMVEMLKMFLDTGEYQGQFKLIFRGLSAEKFRLLKNELQEIITKKFPCIEVLSFHFVSDVLAVYGYNDSSQQRGK
jgi:hypothetical protein